MRGVVQRVQSAMVRVGEKTTGSIGAGLLIYLGIGKTDRTEDAEALAKKISQLRVFVDDKDKMTHSLLDLQHLNRPSAALVVSQFTLFADLSRGRRPSFHLAADPIHAEKLYLHFLNALGNEGVCVEQGRFGAMMQVHSIGDGPVTLCIDTNEA
ncbi:MAG: D-tyrosyl-tRNA(Tyr) deacylase [Myxococcales bacterium]|nr:MAG: D-tyrosyl-tRNA(Tyr) deacylase [Myxococcales bacterium]